MVEENEVEKAFYESAAICTALVPHIGYESAGDMAKAMKQDKVNVFDANKKLKLLLEEQLEGLMQLGNLLSKGFSLKNL